MKPKIIIIFFSVFILFINTACNKKNITESHLILSITDAPYPVGVMESVYITISQIDIKSSEDEFITLLDEDVTINLLELNNGNTLDLFNSDIAADNYNMLRIYITSAIVTLNNGVEYVADINDEVLQGTDVYLNDDVIFEVGEIAEILIDFDVSKSFIPLGNIEIPVSFSGFRFRPVLKATDLNISGSLSGIIINSDGGAVQNATISLLYSGIDYSSTFSDNGGNYKFIGVEEGKYSVVFEADGYKKQLIRNVLIKKDKNTMLNIQFISE